MLIDPGEAVASKPVTEIVSSAPSPQSASFQANLPQPVSLNSSELPKDVVADTPVHSTIKVLDCHEF